MKPLHRFILLLALLGMACRLPAGGALQPPASTAGDRQTPVSEAPPTTPAPAAAALHSPTLPASPPPPAALTPPASPTLVASLTPRPPTELPPVFPDCQPAPVEPYRFDPARFTPFPTPTGQSGLRPLAEARGLLLGTATSRTKVQNPEYAALLTRNFNLLAVENAMKWEVIHPEPERYDFSQADTIVDFARTNGLQVYAHVLAWDLQQPAWLTEGQHTRDEWIQILCQHIKTVAGRYGGQIYAWDVVNEAFQPNGELRDTHWLRVIGPEYIAMAFYWARQADPQALLIYNDTEAEGLNEKSDAIYNLVQALQQQGIPIDGVGLQMHVWLWGPPTPADLRANLQRLADLGLQVHITEMDVRLQYSQDSPAQELDAQAEVYRQALRACLETRDSQGQPACGAFVTWGLTDRHSWIPAYTGHPDAPLLFDQDGQPKPAYWAVEETLK